MIQKTYGTLQNSKITSIFYQRNGYEITVDEIAPIPIGTASNFINVVLDLAVPYKIIAVPQNDENSFEFLTNSKNIDGTPEVLWSPT